MSAGKQINFRIDPELESVIRKKASEQGKSIGQFMQDCARQCLGIDSDSDSANSDSANSDSDSDSDSANSDSANSDSANSDSDSDKRYLEAEISRHEQTLVTHSHDLDEALDRIGKLEKMYQEAKSMINELYLPSNTPIANDSTGDSTPIANDSTGDSTPIANDSTGDSTPDSSSAIPLNKSKEADLYELSQTKLAMRLGCSKSVVNRNIKKGEIHLAQWSKEKDPEGLVWQFNPVTKGCFAQ